MRRISKREKEPRELLEFRKERGASYDGFPRKDVLRDALAEDQGALCCYCMRRISSASDGMKIEHYRCQRHYPELRLQWRNLLGACVGGEGQPRRLQTCDTFKGDQDIKVDPLAESVTQLRYLPDGRVTSPDPEIQGDLDDRLNLNCETLKRNRVAALTGFLEALDRKLHSAKSWTAESLDGELAKLREQRPLREYVGVLEYWLAKHIEQR
jgi:uncharacterized protein (TIGR02646 family)